MEEGKVESAEWALDQDQVIGNVFGYGIVAEAGLRSLAWI